MKRISAYFLVPFVGLFFLGCGDDGGPACGDDVVDATEECDDGNTTSGDGCSDMCLIEGPAPQMVETTVNCCVGGPVASCGVGSELPIPITIVVDLAEAVTSGAAVDYTARIDATLGAGLGDVVIGALGTDTITLTSFTFDLGTVGATPATATFEDANVPRDVDVDANDDGMAEDVTMTTGGLDGSLTHDGAAADVTMSLAGMIVGIEAGGAPITLTIPTPDPAPGGTIVYCDLPDPADTTITLAVE